jgi:hypothetical protein
MEKIKKRKKSRPGTIISAYISLEAFNKLQELHEKYNISQSKMIEKMILMFYKAAMEKEEATDEATATAQ